MKNYFFRDREKKKGYIRIDKRTARKLFNAGENIHFIPCNCSPVSPIYSLGITSNINMWGFDGIPENDRFEKMVNEFTWYNCNKETGIYPAYYMIINE